MTRVLICGAGRVGVATAAVFSQFPDYEIYLADNRFDCAEANHWLNQQKQIRTIAIDVCQTESLIEYCRNNAINVIVATLLTNLNQPIIEAAISCHIHYVDCSPKVMAFDEQLQKRISNSEKAIVPNSGLAPGWTGLIANHFMQQLETDIFCQVQVGVIADEMTYSLSGSAKRFMLELTEPASLIKQGELTQVTPLKEVWPVQIGERNFESTHAANGYGHLLSLWKNRVSHLSYQTLLPPGMADKIQFLIKALRLHEQPQSMRELLAPVFSRQEQDALWVRIECKGNSHQQSKILRFEQVIQPYIIEDYSFSALQISTAIGIGALVDVIISDSSQYKGLIAQESMDFNTWLTNRFTKLLIKQDGFSQKLDKESSTLNTTL